MASMAFTCTSEAISPIKRLLARMTDYIETGRGGEPRYAEYMTLRGKNGYEVEHIWAGPSRVATR